LEGMGERGPAKLSEYKGSEGKYSYTGLNFLRVLVPARKGYPR